MVATVSATPAGLWWVEASFPFTATLTQLQLLEVLLPERGTVGVSGSIRPSGGQSAQLVARCAGLSRAKPFCSRAGGAVLGGALGQEVTSGDTSLCSGL